jgi:hypothetical protein
VLPKFSIGGGDEEQRFVRRFTDAKGLEWEVYSVVNPPAENDGGGIPATFLCFERGVDRRRLAPIPDDWKECDADVLRRYLEKARGVHRSFASPDQFRERRR